MSSSFRLHVLGTLLAGEAGTLISLCEFQNARCLSRTELSVESGRELSRRVQVLRSHVETGFPDFTYKQLKELGAALFDLVLSDNVRRLFDEASGKATQQGLLPFELFVEDPSLIGWPWEYLYDRTHQRFLCEEFHPISRGVFTLGINRELPTAPIKIRILLIIGVPPNDQETTPLEEEKALREVFLNYLGADNFTFKVVLANDPQWLDHHLQETEYDIVHFFGHAGFDTAREEGYLRCDRPGKAPFRFYANHFANMLATQRVRLVFLNGCKTAVGSESETPTRSAVAAALLDRGVPAVVGAQYSMPDASAHFLSSTIYHALVNGKTLTAAIRDGRRALEYADAKKFFDWGIPIIYTTDPSIVLFPRKQTPSDESSDLEWPGVAEDENGARDVKGVDLPDGLNQLPMVVDRTKSSQSNFAKYRVAIVDLDTRAGFLPDLIERANAVQSYYAFEVVYMPVPSGYERELDSATQTYIPHLSGLLKARQSELKVNHLCCLTANMLAGEEESETYYNYFTVGDDPDVSFVSTYGVREYARLAKVSFAGAILYLCISMLLISDPRWELSEHEETLGCLFDFCELRSDLVIGLRNRAFDHQKCRRRIQDRHQLEAVDTLLALRFENVVSH